jgi:leukotriene-A4 hydrolase
MRQRRLLLVVLSFFMLVAARQRAVRHPSQGWPLTAAPFDKFSVSQPSEVTTEHLDLDLTVDFPNRRLQGSATLHIRNITGTTSLRLDADGLEVDRVTLDGDTPAQWTLSQPPNLQALNVTIAPTTETVTVYYRTASDRPGLYWHSPDETYGDVQPYLYSLNEPTGARAWIPIQDTPSIRMTYNAVIHAPRGLMAVMSAENNPRTPTDTGVYMFNMSYPIPAYLIAIAVGRFEFRELDERTGVYAEPELIDDAEWELQYLPAMVDAGEKLLGSFPFPRHDEIFMPPDFVAGGMEHPMINFITPNMLLGLRPEVPRPSTLIAHELAHTWSGDQTTLANWNDVWLNEGITSYLTVRLIEALMGAEEADYLWWNDRRNYQGFIDDPAVDPQETIMHFDAPYPFFGFGPAGYVKGELFMKTVEDTMGRAQFDQFLWRYFRTFSFRWVNDVNFLALLRTFLTPDVEQRLQLQQWLYQPGLPSNITAPASSVLNQRAIDRASAFNSGTPIAQLAPATWSSLDITLFLQYASFTSRMAQVEAALSLSSRPSPPTAWLNASIRTNYAPGLAAVERMLARPGPASRIVNLYRVFNETPSGHNRALQLFNLYRAVYDRRTEERVATVLGLINANGVREAA